MAYSENIKEMAFQLWAVAGSVEDAVKRLQREFPGVSGLSAVTVQRWKKSGGWDERKSTALSEVHDESDRQLAEDLTGVGEQVFDLLTALLDQARGLTFNSAASAYQTLPGMVRLYKNLTGLGVGGEADSPKIFRKYVEAFSKSLREVSMFRDLLEQYPALWKQLIDRLKVNLGED